MTGSLLLYNRQYSSTAGNSTTNKMNRPKLRRCSSADEHNPIEVIPDDIQYKEKLYIKRNQTPSDIDSGTEDFDQQIGNLVVSPTNNDDKEEASLSFGAYEDEGYDEYVPQNNTKELEDPEQQVVQRIYNDLTLAAKVPDNEKKDFCYDTSEVFHGEFARLIALPLALKYPGAHYHLFVEDGVEGDPCQWTGFGFVKLDNAKAQFKCPNIHCGRLWTSMRARISFKISQPQLIGFVVLKIYGQNCKDCETPADALWYFEEVCRVMDNLSKSIFEKYFPSMNDNVDLQGKKIMTNLNNVPSRLRHDPGQRRGTMHAPHDRNLCEACQRGWCFA